METPANKLFEDRTVVMWVKHLVSTEQEVNMSLTKYIGVISEGESSRYISWLFDDDL
jgi:hypothetical protein